MAWDESKLRPMPKRFWAKVSKGSSCWLWCGGRSSTGYGIIGFPRKGGSVSTHRYIWELTYGPIPQGMFVCHSCDVRNCVNPEHLFLGTAKDNIHDAITKGRIDPRRIGSLGPRLKGADHKMAKLSADDVRAIRRLRQLCPPVSYRHISCLFPVTPTQACRITLRKSWSSIA